MTELEKLQKYVNDKRDRIRSEGNFSLLHTKYFEDLLQRGNVRSIKGILEIIESWDGAYNIPYNLGVSIDHFVENPNTTVCIHRTKLDIDKEAPGVPQNTDLNSIMTEGLINNGDVMAVGGSAFSNNLPDLIKTMTPMKGLSGYINLIASYHSNDTIVMASFPSTLVNKDGEIIGDYSEVYDLSSGIPHVKPEYIMGAIVKKDGKTFEFYTKDEIVFANQQKNNRNY